MSKSKEITILSSVRIKIDSEHHERCSPDCPMMHKSCAWGRNPTNSCRLFGEIRTKRKFEDECGYYGCVVEEITYRSNDCMNCLPPKGEM